MRISISWLERQIACCLVTLLVCILGRGRGNATFRHPKPLEPLSQVRLRRKPMLAGRARRPLTAASPHSFRTVRAGGAGCGPEPADGRFPGRCRQSAELRHPKHQRSEIRAATRRHGGGTVCASPAVLRHRGRPEPRLLRRSRDAVVRSRSKSASWWAPASRLERSRLLPWAVPAGHIKTEIQLYRKQNHAAQSQKPADHACQFLRHRWRRKEHADRKPSQHLDKAGLRVELITFWDDVARLKQIREGAGHKLFKGDKGVGTPEAPIHRRDKNVRSPLMTLIRLGIYFLDAVSLRVMVAKALRSDADVVIFDRYIYDELANLNLGNPVARLYLRGVMKAGAEAPDQLRARRRSGAGLRSQTGIPTRVRPCQPQFVSHTEPIAGGHHGDTAHAARAGERRKS